MRTSTGLCRQLVSCCVLAAAGLSLQAGVARAVPADPAATPLDTYLSGLKTLRASFVQTLVDAQGRETDRTSGTLIVQRPGRFRWEIQPQRVDGAGAGPGGPAADAGQLMVCDGTNLWFYDRELGQVTVKPVDAALSATPVMLLSGAADIRRDFTVAPAGERSGLTWVLVTPRAAAADFRQALLGFSSGELRRMILEDKLGQTATVIFSSIQRNAPVNAAEVSFQPPPGVDVIGTPRQ
ncbi:MAG: outer membrane lipoprotein chaperone LolA [Proteobacteria bacterium]|nr:outer membrane lipoprotein chaperone LolA [Pseudomonadota bacterium]